VFFCWTSLTISLLSNDVLIKVLRDVAVEEKPLGGGCSRQDWRPVTLWYCVWFLVVVLRMEQFQSPYCTHRAMRQLVACPHLNCAPEHSEHSSHFSVVAYRVATDQIGILGAVGTLELFSLENNSCWTCSSFDREGNSLWQFSLTLWALTLHYKSPNTVWMKSWSWLWGSHLWSLKVRGTSFGVLASWFINHLVDCKFINHMKPYRRHDIT
jgi:hypothetical protein